MARYLYLAENLRRIRLERRLSQQALAAGTIGTISQSRISELKNGQYVRDDDEICRLAAALSVEPSALTARHVVMRVPEIADREQLPSLMA